MSLCVNTREEKERKVMGLWVLYEVGGREVFLEVKLSVCLFKEREDGGSNRGKGL